MTLCFATLCSTPLALAQDGDEAGLPDPALAAEAQPSEPAPVPSAPSTPSSAIDSGTSADLPSEPAESEPPESEPVTAPLVDNTPAPTTPAPTTPAPTTPAPTTPAPTNDNTAASLEDQQRLMETGAVRATPAPEVRELDTELSHESQFYVRALAALPYVLGLKYGDSNRCAPDRPDREFETFCRRLGQLALEGEVGHGFTERIEVGVFGRYSLADDPHYKGRSIRFGLVFRSYVAPLAVVKPYFAVRAYGDYLPGKPVDEANEHPVLDFGFGAEFGLQVDLIRNVGLFAQVGIQFTFLRSFFANPEATLGLQIRFP